MTTYKKSLAYNFMFGMVTLGSRNIIRKVI